MIIRGDTWKSKMCIGTDKESGEPVMLEAEMKLKNQEVKTISHNSEGRYYAFSVSGFCGDNYAGQIYDHLTSKNIIFDMGYSEARVQSMVKYWKEWHLNDLQPNCIHQKSFNCNLPNYTEKAQKETNKCPKGYGYGSAWLLKPISEATNNKLKMVFRAR